MLAKIEDCSEFPLGIFIS